MNLCWVDSFLNHCEGGKVQNNRKKYNVTQSMYNFDFMIICEPSQR